MSNQEQESTEVTSVSENPEIQTTNENQTLNNNEDIEKSNVNEKSSSSENNTSNEQETTRRILMPQDIRYSTEQGDREKLMEKYNNYQISDKNSCNIRFLTDHRQKKNLLSRHEEENSSLHSIANIFHVKILPGYQNPTKHSFKIFGTEANVRKCLIELMNRMFKHLNRTTIQNDSENINQQTPTQNIEKPQETEVSIDNEKSDDKSSSSHVTSEVITTINPDSSISEEKTDTNKDDNIEQEQLKFIPIERKPEYTFSMLITSQGQEVLKKNWSFFAGSLQQRLNVTVTNPLKLPKFGDKQWQNELSITGDLYENIIDAALQITAFINDVLGIPIQPYKDEEHTIGDNNNYQRTKTNNNNDYHQQQRRHDYNNSYRQSPSQYQGQSSPFNNYHERTFFNRGRNGAFEQVILIRSNCAARIIGTRGSNLRRIQAKCHLRDIGFARHPNENGYVECTLSAYQTRNLNFAIDTIRGYLRNEDDQAMQIFDSYYVETPLQSSSSFHHSPQYDQPQLSIPNQNLEHFHQHNLSNNRYQEQEQHHQQQEQEQQLIPFTTSADLSQVHKELGFMTRPLHLANNTQLPQPSYNFQNTPSFDFTHRPTSASRKTDKRPGEVNDFNNTNNIQNRTSNDFQYQQYGDSSSSNSSSISPRHKSKRTCPETKEIDCTTDDGFWIQKQYYNALDDTSKELFDSLLDKLEKIRIVSEENAVRKQQRLVGRNRPNKSRIFNSSISSITQTNDEKDLTIQSTQDVQDNKTDELTNVDEQEEKKDLTISKQETTTDPVDEK
ncbi:unnamed protein product [Rotaria sordida]|uniref:K Homology domain-containing protein n=1 Tax=Rotaria sordida TaxID=392033 RepID=A0A814HIS4_9BILA|nr:unnamed protein product [Rotaria sordida]CAF1010750.1 unnamed protein product [Rotaria sordida]